MLKEGLKRGLQIFLKPFYLIIKVITPNRSAAAIKPIPKRPATIPVLRYTETAANSFPCLSDIKQQITDVDRKTI